ncbi:MAG: hypothetical protein QXF12_04050 [Candidatus Aenigmatarchaeota archaeon]
MSNYVHPLLNTKLNDVADLFEEKILMLRLNKKRDCLEINQINNAICETLSINISLAHDLFTEYIIMRKNSIKLPLHFIDIMRSIYKGDKVQDIESFEDTASCLGLYDPQSGKLTNAGENYLFMKYKGLNDNKKDLHISRKHLLIVEKVIYPTHESDIHKKGNLEDYEYLVYHGIIKKEGEYYFITRKTQEYLSKKKYKKPYYIYKYEDIVPYIQTNSEPYLILR